MIPVRFLRAMWLINSNEFYKMKRKKLKRNGKKKNRKKQTNATKKTGASSNGLYKIGNKFLWFMVEIKGDTTNKWNQLIKQINSIYENYDVSTVATCTLIETGESSITQSWFQFYSDCKRIIFFYHYFLQNRYKNKVGTFRYTMYTKHETVLDFARNKLCIEIVLFKIVLFSVISFALVYLN